MITPAPVAAPTTPCTKEGGGPLISWGTLPPSQQEQAGQRCMMPVLPMSQPVAAASQQASGHILCTSSKLGLLSLRWWRPGPLVLSAPRQHSRGILALAQLTPGLQPHAHQHAMPTVTGIQHAAGCPGQQRGAWAPLPPHLAAGSPPLAFALLATGL
jgi:hypothetical protein